MHVCGRVCACVCVMSVGHRGEFVRGAAVVKATAAHRQVVGSSPTREVCTSFLVGSHTLPRTISPLLPPWEPLGFLRPYHPCHTHSCTHARTSTHTCC